jgi:hypothetical protein
MPRVGKNTPAEEKPKADYSARAWFTVRFRSEGILGGKNGRKSR